ncbi:MAG: phospholipase [Chlorobiaceae bacterium]|nr:phospholipase [Chlorobiaceae bacterium]
MQEHRLPVMVSGRYLVKAPRAPGAFPLLAGFHGYGQTAEHQLDLLDRIPGSDRWIRCSIEALHPFMNDRGDAGASWMTTRDRELRIVENVAYVDAVLGRLLDSSLSSGTVVLHGFSQGAGMACRAAVLGCHRVSAVMLVGGDVPPELEWLEPMRSVHLARGDRDRLYTQERFAGDRERLRGAGVAVAETVFRGGHGPEAGYFAAAGCFLAGVA